LDSRKGRRPRRLRELGRRKPGDIILRTPREAAQRLRRVLTVPALFSVGYGDVGSSIYYALGIVALVAVGATPIALFAAGLIFVCNALSYAEGGAMLPEAGGSSSWARHGFNRTVGFLAGWALLLSYIVTISLSAFTIPPYLGYFWEPLKTDPLLGTIVSMGIVLFLMFINIIGVRESSWVNISAAVLDVVTQASLVLIGVVLILSPDVLQFSIANLKQNMFGAGNWPSASNLIFGIALAALAYTGVETISQMAEETRRPQIRLPKALMMMIVVVMVMFSGISVVALSAMPAQTLATEWARDPVAGIAQSFPSAWLRDIFRPLVGILAATILLIASNAGLMGSSRLIFALGANKQLPSVFNKVHRRFKTPYVTIIAFGALALLILSQGLFNGNVIGFFRDLGGLYVFGSLLTFAFAHASILALRVRKPELPRPFKLRANIKVRGRELPITAVLGLLATSAIWVVIMVIQPYSRWVGLAWMLVGLVIAVVYSRRRRAEDANAESETEQAA